MRARALTLLAAAVVTGCGADEPEPGFGVPASLQVGGPDPVALATVASEPVVGWTGPGGEPFEVVARTVGGRHIYRRIGMEDFDISLRTGDPELTEFPCTSCHQGRRVTSGRDADAHEDIRASHPAATGANCVICHAPAAVDRLLLQTGETVPLRQGYRLCAQCHYSQTDDWAAGSHGKRLDGWRGRRVVMGCADCHDPHRPELEPRIPYPGPRMPGGDALSPEPEVRPDPFARDRGDGR